jgi:hypothetical protein
MGLWDKIRDKILPPRKDQPVDDIAKPDPYGLPDMSSLQPSDTGTATTTAPTTTAAVDVEQVLEARLADKGNPDLDWRTSIVDLMKLLDLDSSLSARQELAQELGYTGDTNDSAAMNVWLHKQVMKKLAESGGKVPEELRS